MHTDSQTFTRRFALPVVGSGAEVRDDTPSPTANSPIAQKTIGEILDGCVEVPDNVRGLLQPVSGYKIERLLNALRRIKNTTPCGFAHEERDAKAPPDKFINFVEHCSRRENSPGCGHQGIKALELAVKRRGGEDDFNLDSDNINNPTAKIIFALALVLAIGNHNQDASSMIDELMQEARTANLTDKKASYYYKATLKGETAPPEPSDEVIDFTKRQQATAHNITAIKDKALALLEADVAHLAAPSASRRPSGALNENIGKIDWSQHDHHLKAVSAMLR